jgi:acyl-CoA reductase-like NAD-dependent aldehyde dehydrogenase
MDIINPATGTVITNVQEDTLESIHDKFKLLQEGRASWSSCALENRLQSISTFSQKLEEQKEKLAFELMSETGKPLTEAINEINGARDKIQFFLNESAETLKPKIVNENGNTKEEISYDPLGIVANISAWNYPYLVGINNFIPALICGNSVFYKPSELSTLTGLHITRLLHQSGVPENVFQVVIGDGLVAQHLLDLELDGQFFTGSYRTGQHIHKSVAHQLIPVGLELGGKDPLYVTDDVANIKSCAESVAEGAFYNNGQSCCSVERVYIQESIYEEFCQHFIEVVSQLKVGDPTKKETQQGAITRPEHLIFLKNQVVDALNKGAVCECGGDIVLSPGNFFTPTVLTNVDHTMDVMKEETFGPVIGLMKVKSDKQAIELMNDTVYGLTSSVFTSNQQRGRHILSKIDSGTGYLNCCDRVSGYLPWSGRGHSGLGTALSIHGIYAFCRPKAFHIRS